MWRASVGLEIHSSQLTLLGSHLGRRSSAHGQVRVFFSESQRAMMAAFVHDPPLPPPTILPYVRPTSVLLRRILTATQYVRASGAVNRVGLVVGTR
jgi:hypothetical protein